MEDAPRQLDNPLKSGSLKFGTLNRRFNKPLSARRNREWHPIVSLVTNRIREFGFIAKPPNRYWIVPERIALVAAGRLVNRRLLVPGPLRIHYQKGPRPRGAIQGVDGFHANLANPVDEYLSTSDPAGDREYLDGLVVEGKQWTIAPYRRS